MTKAAGANNVGFHWCPGEKASRGGRPQINASYPGDVYVDWIGSDGYDADDTTSFSMPTHDGWAEVNEIFNYNVSGLPSMEQHWGPSKPVVPGETGTKYDTPNVDAGHVVDPNRKANWFRNIPGAIAEGMPYMIGIMFFDQDVHIFEAGNNWRVDSNCNGVGTNCNSGSTDAATYHGFIDMSHAAVFNSGVAGGTS